jgi:hypothetical protein
MAPVGPGNTHLVFTGRLKNNRAGAAAIGFALTFQIDCVERSADASSSTDEKVAIFVIMATFCSKPCRDATNRPRIPKVGRFTFALNFQISKLGLRRLVRQITAMPNPYPPPSPLPTSPLPLEWLD